MGNTLSTIVQLTTANKKVVVFLVIALTFLYFKHQSKSKPLITNKQEKNQRLQHNNDKIIKMKSKFEKQQIDKEQVDKEQIDEKEKKIKARERFEKKQKQRMKEKEETKQRRIQKEEEKKKKKKAILLKKKMAKRQQETLKKRDELRQKTQKKKDNYSAKSNKNECEEHPEIEAKLGSVERKVLSSLTKQEDKEDKQELDDSIHGSSGTDEKEKKDSEKEEEDEMEDIDDMNVSHKSFKEKSLKSMDNYNKLRERFASRYQDKDKLFKNENEKDNDKDNDNDNDKDKDKDKKDGEKVKDGDKNEEKIKHKNKKRRSMSAGHNDERYKGNEEIIKLRALYKKQHKMKQKLLKLRDKKMCAPSKPIDIESFLNDETRFILNELKQCICKNTRFQGLADFGSNGKLGIELEITSNADNNGYLNGKRVIQFRGMKEIRGKARIYFDLSWNGDKYVPCCKFEWIDEDNGIITKCEFDSAKNEIDLNHSFFNGKCIRYPSSDNNTNCNIMHEGYFDFLCVSARRREIKHNSFFNLYHALDINEMTENELQKLPKYLRRMKDYTDKINDQLYGDNITGDSLLDQIGE